MSLIGPDPAHDGRQVDDEFRPNFPEKTDDGVTIAEITVFGPGHDDFVASTLP